MKAAFDANSREHRHMLQNQAIQRFVRNVPDDMPLRVLIISPGYYTDQFVVFPVLESFAMARPISCVFTIDHLSQRASRWTFLRETCVVNYANAASAIHQGRPTAVASFGEPRTEALLLAYSAGLPVYCSCGFQDISERGNRLGAKL